MKRKIVTTGTDTQHNHRGDFETCPNCDYRMDSEKWDAIAQILILSPRCYKAGCVAVMAECPTCFTRSWVHETMSRFGYNDDIPESWKKRVAEIEAAVKLQALRSWGAGICHKCKHLESGRVEYHAWRNCIIGSGPAETECKKFEPIKPK